jgi:hypothetical protein
MGPQPEVGLLGGLVMAPGGQLPQPPAAIGAGEPADRDGHAVDQRDRRVELDPAEQVPVQLGLDRPQVGRLPGEAGAMDPAQTREPIAPVAAEVLVPADVGVDAEELPDPFDGQDLAVGQGRQPRSSSGVRMVGQPRYLVDALDGRVPFGPTLTGKALQVL